MPNYDLLRQNPFFLDDEHVAWVKNTLENMTKEEKIGHLFCFANYGWEEEELARILDHYKLGAIMGRGNDFEKVWKSNKFIQEHAKIPLLIAANFEAGGDGIIKKALKTYEDGTPYKYPQSEGTNVGPNLMIGATDDPQSAAKQGYVCAKEGLAVGANWAFAPVIDIDKNWRNPIMATRLYSSKDKLVADCGRAYTIAAQKEGMAVSIKHFPGDGVDERDQHLVISINDLSCEEWDATYGAAYKASIDAGALSVMVGHILQPAYSRKFIPGIADKDIMPATLAPELLNGLLRGKLGFNGVIVTDASTMNGFCSAMDRKDAVPGCIAAGCDIFLFTQNVDEDYEFMCAGVENGTITPERLDEAVMRTLGMKAALRLPDKKADGTILPPIEEAAKIVGCQEFREIEKEVADKSVTLVKNNENLLPIDRSKIKRIYLYPIAAGRDFGSTDEELGGYMKERLEAEGFEVEVFKRPEGREGAQRRAEDMKASYDLLLYVCNLATYSNQTVVRITWSQPMGFNCPNYIKSIPTAFISFANPYHLVDVPRIPTFINAYKFKEATVDAVIDKMLGRSPFKGVNPVDPFCGKWDTRL